MNEILPLNKTSHQTALLIFARSAKNEAMHKNLLKNHSLKHNIQLSEVLISKTKNTSQKTGLEIIECNDLNQKGNIFEERLANAIEHTFDLGFDSVITIGTDTPALTSDIIKKGLESLQHADLILGPSTDGGIYLIGLNRSTYNRKNFMALPWLSDQLFQNSYENAQNQGLGVVCLERLIDVDDTQDLYAVFQHLRPTDILFQLLLLLLNILRESFITHQVSPCSNPISAFGLRAPPMA